MHLPHELFGMVSCKLHLHFFFFRREGTLDVDAPGGETLKVKMVNFVLCHKTGSGPADIVAFAFATTDIFGIDDFLPETTRFFARRAEGDNLETHFFFWGGITP